MPTLQVIITTFDRLKYLKLTLDSLINNASGDYDLDIYVIDGGSTNDDTVGYIRRWFEDGSLAGYALFEGNPGADVLKSYGVDRFMKSAGVLTSDDLGYPVNWDRTLIEAAREFPSAISISCKIDNFDQDYFGMRRGKFKYTDALPYQPCGLLKKAAFKEIGYWPRQYGVTGCGDFAITARLSAKGYQTIFIENVELIHYGQNKPEDYPEQYAFYLEHEKVVYPLATADALPDIPLSHFVPWEERSV
jgi:GT2 family glycosyltransferase